VCARVLWRLEIIFPRVSSEMKHTQLLVLECGDYRAYNEFLGGVCWFIVL
jgi:hypothetical protein